MPKPQRKRIIHIHYHTATNHCTGADYHRIGIGRIIAGASMGTVRNYDSPTPSSVARLLSLINYHLDGKVHLFTDGWGWVRELSSF